MAHFTRFSLFVAFTAVALAIPFKRQNTAISSIYLTGVYTVNDETITASGLNLSSSTADESVVLVTNSGDLTLSNSEIWKLAGDTSADGDSSFYGLNAAVVAQNGSTLTLTDSQIYTYATGGNGVFSTYTDTTVTVSNVEIQAYCDSCRGLYVSMEGTMYASDMTIHTRGAHASAMAHDSGGGLLVVHNAVAQTEGSGSLIIYSTGNFTGTNITGTSAVGPATGMDGLNSITITDSNLIALSNAGIQLYQSTSKSTDGYAYWKATGGSLTSYGAPLVFVTNTIAELYFDGVTLSTDSGYFFEAYGSDWGSTGSNGGVATITATNQVIDGDIWADEYSSVALSLTESSSLVGAINYNDTASSANLTIDSTSTWTATDTSYITALTVSDPTTSINSSYTIYYNADVSSVSGTYTLSGGGSLKPV